MKIFLTGAGGMVGRNILEHPSAAGVTFLTPSRTEVNLEDYDAVYTFIREQKPDLVIHAAGRVGGIQANMAHPVDFLVQNLDMGRNVIMAAKNAGVPRLLNLASSCMYPREAINPLGEDLVLKGELEPTNEGYAIAKIVATRLCEYISREHPSLLYKTVIPCNLYGRYDKFAPEHSHMVPAVIRKIHFAAANGQSEIDIWGDGMSRREFMYAGDLADFVFFALDRFEKLPQNLNVGLGHDFTINQYYEAIAHEIGYRGRFIHDLSKPTGMRQKLVDTTLLKQLGWQPETSLPEGIRKTYDYFKNRILHD
ncbi:MULTISPECIES: GDP-L-fucose synthase [unclassified Flavobacterium]|uniref:GDP-L-fucose synthase family protein n=1 Tax=unclassified Flavobacterium TaxID=196869 RepID=UPI001F138C70|nr:MULTISPECIES: GDP-L-fucose synthase [unclassified Flavobacterium]UMY66390.1 GDP-L-fucose synthase [Flavobacterium sp. HJ-32-4]HLN95638.1 GDP-L-fucose synthase [Flavobacterium sp.]